MSVYLDTSLLVAALTTEPSSRQASAWLRSNTAMDFAISHWVLAEFASAISLKVRTGQMLHDDQPKVLAGWASLYAGFSMYPVEPAHFLAAAQICEQHDLGLRAGDALHITIARAAGCTLATLDRRMAEAAGRLGVAVAAI